MPGERTIEGAPCKPIETADDFAAFDFAAFEGSRRPANPTVPFPRPRPVPRTATMPNPSMSNPSEETPDIGGGASWHGTTTRTLRFVFTSPDHKPQRVAAIMVCAVAALVIFAVGRSPIAGTAGIGQTTGALSADPNPKPASPPPQPASDPSTELAKASGSDSSTDSDEPSDLAQAREVTPPAGDELAPGLVVPREAAPDGSDLTLPAADVSSSDTSPSNPLSSNPSGAAKGRPAAAPQPAAKPPVKKAPPPPPPPPSSLPTPARKNSTELDFGI
jgi:cell division protein FtsN